MGLFYSKLPEDPNEIQVCNAYPLDLYVIVGAGSIIKSEKKVVNSDTNYSGNAGLPGKGSLDLGGTAHREQVQENQKEFHMRKDAKYFKLKRYDTTSVSPELDDGKSAYVSVFLLLNDHAEDLMAEDNRHYIANDVPFKPPKAVIITNAGTVVSAKSKDSPWIDSNDMDHSEKCRACHEISKVCTLCTLSSGFLRMNTTIDALTECSVTTNLACLTTEIESEISSYKDHQTLVTGITNDINKLAETYGGLQGKTKIAVMEVDLYGKKLIKAGDAYVEDNDFKEFLDEVRDMTGLKNAIRDCMEEHSQIKRKAGDITTKAAKAQKKISEQAEEKVNRNKKQIEFIANVDEEITAFDFGDIHLQGKFSGSTLAKLEEFKMAMENSGLEKLIRHFNDIEGMMSKVSQHLASLDSIVGNIYMELGLAIHEEKKVRDYHRDKKEKHRIVEKAKSVIEASKKLVTSCQAYRNMVDNPMPMSRSSDTKALEYS